MVLELNADFFIIGRGGFIEGRQGLKIKGFLAQLIDLLIAKLKQSLEIVIIHKKFNYKVKIK
jgi:hypothetical protein